MKFVKLGNCVYNIDQITTLKEENDFYLVWFVGDVNPTRLSKDYGKTLENKLMTMNNTEW